MRIRVYNPKTIEKKEKYKLLLLVDFTSDPKIKKSPIAINTNPEMILNISLRVFLKKIVNSFPITGTLEIRR